MKRILDRATLGLAMGCGVTLTIYCLTGELKQLPLMVLLVAIMTCRPKDVRGVVDAMHAIALNNRKK